MMDGMHALSPRTGLGPLEAAVIEVLADLPAASSFSKSEKAVGTEVDVSPDAFHTFAVSWDRENLVWFVDGREVKREPTPSDMHKPMYLRNIYNPDDCRPLSDLRDKYIGVLSGIARPESFEDTLRKLGAKLEITTRFADHHRFRGQELQDFVARAVRRDLDFIVTTEKDCVRFPSRIGAADQPEIPIYFLRVEIEILAGQEHWDRLIARLTERRDVVAPERVLV